VLGTYSIETGTAYTVVQKCFSVQGTKQRHIFLAVL